MSQTLPQPISRAEGLRASAWVEPMVERRLGRGVSATGIPADRVTPGTAPVAPEPAANESQPEPPSAGGEGSARPAGRVWTGPSRRQEPESRAAEVEPGEKTLKATVPQGERTLAPAAAVLPGSERSCRQQQPPEPVLKVIEEGPAPQQSEAPGENSRRLAGLIRPAGFPAALLDSRKQPAGKETPLAVTVFPTAAVAPERLPLLGAPGMPDVVATGGEPALAGSAAAHLEILFGTPRSASPNQPLSERRGQESGGENRYR